ncbi:MAG: S8 family serine peptidase [Lachnospiraceae bacterium]|nr:S8 family serine peptidase [Lachnospiraceae bacterium]
MDSQKLENLLNVALQTDKNVLNSGNDIGVGYDSVENTWELIVKYNGDLTFVESLGGTVEELILGYAIIVIPEERIPELVQRPEIEYVEKPKRLFYSILDSKRVSCIFQTVTVPFNLSGKGILVGVLDSGLDVWDRDFRNKNGTTRVKYLYDQQTGVEWAEEEINDVLLSRDVSGISENSLPIDVSGHGTAVTKIAAGNGNGSGERFRGVAPESDLIIVKLGNSVNDSFPRTTQLMSGLTYVVKKAVSMNLPIAINLSFGNTYGSHDGTSILERFMDNISEIGRGVICVGSGNEATAFGHVGGFLQSGERIRQQFSIGEYETGLSVQLWKNYVDRFRISFIAPDGQRIEVDTSGLGKRVNSIAETDILTYVGEPAPYSVNQEIYFELSPQNTQNNSGRYLNSGVWEMQIVGEQIVYGRYDMYMPSGVTRGNNTRFVTPSLEATFTIPSTAGKVVTVGAYNSATDSYASFSGRGFSLGEGQKSRIVIQSVKPDIAAPGENIVISRRIANFLPSVPSRNQGREEYTIEAVSGTSFATPIVTGSAALLMEWGIVNGNDPYLYGQKVKAYLINGARRISGVSEYPNSQVGWGALCVRDSLPI